jgi:rhamnogalacturonan endolyase
MFHSAHYAGIELCPSFEEGEAWKKVFGPVLIYLNSAPTGTPYPALWQDAKSQVSSPREGNEALFVAGSLFLICM